MHHKVRGRQPFTKRVTPQASHAQVEGQPARPPRLTSDACCGPGGPARSDDPLARKTVSAPGADLCSNDSFSCTSQNCLPVLASGSESGRSFDSETRAASGEGTCSPWTCGSSSPWSLCREPRGAPVWVASHSGCATGSGTWTLQMSSHCRFSCEGQGDRLPQMPEERPPGLCIRGKRPPASTGLPRHTPPLRRHGSGRGPRAALLTAPAPTPTASRLRQAERGAAVTGLISANPHGPRGTQALTRSRGCRPWLSSRLPFSSWRSLLRAGKPCSLYLLWEIRLEPHTRS